MFLIPAAAAFLGQLAVMVVSTGRQFSGQRGDLAIAAFIGGVVGLYALGRIVAGLCYLFSRGRMTRQGRALVATGVIVVLSFLGYFVVVARV
jgi:hypothetical protein